MTLRHRLLLVYLIVVLLSVATVGVAIYELNRTQNIYGPLWVWHDLVRDVQRLKTAFKAMTDRGEAEDETRSFDDILSSVRRKLALAGEYLDVDYIQEVYLYRVHRAYRSWQQSSPQELAESTQRVDEILDALFWVVDNKLDQLNQDLEEQQEHKMALVVATIGLSVLHVVVVGWLLRRWLLWPMERLNRQVEALAKDQPSPEPLLTAPLEMARLAAALDRARQSLQTYRQQLIDNERLTTIGQFAAQLAHNLRNPLASIRAAAQITARHERGNEYVHERMGDVIACVDRLNHWIAGLTEVARQDPTPTRNIDVVPLLHRVREAVEADLAIKEIVLTIDAPAEGLACVHDPATLEQALIAMVVNAIEASPLGKGITLRAERITIAGSNGDDESKTGEPEGNGLMAGWEVGQLRNSRPGVNGGPRGVICRISVNDEGPGLPVDQPERIFEFPYSTKQKGMGLGLALARLALERQGGEAHACNRPEGGAMVYVDLSVGPGEK